jgi:LysR family glycine cleavage system transcriptional activator
MSRNIPQFAALRAFEATARLGSLRRAAEELSLTPSAISHQIKAAEKKLGILLFERSSAGMTPTETGRFYARELAAALDRIATATATVSSSRQPHSVSINMYPLLAALWIMPHFSDFMKLHPDYDVKFLTSMDPLDLHVGPVDLAIRYAREPPNEYRVDPLFSELQLPVCSPAYAAHLSNFSLRNPKSRIVLIHCQTTPGEWKQWLAGTRYRVKARIRHLDFASRFLALEAASDGLGVAMGRTPFVERSLEAGRLTCPFGTPLPTGYGYYLVASERVLQVPAVVAFQRWLISLSHKLARGEALKST